jgi:uncharacterized protein (DUF58 family)
MEQKPEFRLKLNTWLLPMLVGVLLVLQITSPYRGWVVFLVGLGGMWLISYVWVRLLARGLRFSRAMRFGWVQVGDRLEERFELANEVAIPALWVEVVDHSTVPGYPVGWTTQVEAHRLRRWSRWATSSRRGLFTLGPTTLLTGDPFGVYTASLHYPTSMPFLVLPPVFSLPSIRVAPGGLSGEGSPRPNAPERTISAATVREYIPGDSQRWIHWRTTARKDSLYVRLFDGTPAGDWWIVLDMDRRVQAGEGGDSTEEHGVVLAASLANLGLQLCKSVGLVMHGQDLVWLPPESGDTRLWRILRDLALVSPGPCPLSDLLMQMKPVIGQHASLVVITPAVDRGWVEAMLPLMRRGVVPTVLLLDPTAFGGDGDASEALELLTNLETTHYIIAPDLLNSSEAQPSWQETWGWEVLDSGRVVPTGQPRDAAWRVLA